MGASEKRARCLACRDWHPVGAFRTVKDAGFDSAVCKRRRALRGLDVAGRFERWMHRDANRERLN